MTKTTLIDALASALPTLGGAKKNAANPAFKSKYADLGAVIEAIRPVADHGIWYLQYTYENERGAQVETFFVGHGEMMSAGTVFIPASKDNAHGFGSALTYARRYGLQTAFGLPVEDDDGNAASEAPPKARSDKMPDAEWAALQSMVKATQASIPAMLNHLNIVLRNDDLSLLNQDQYARVMEALRDKLAKMAKAETDAKAMEDA